MQVEMRYEDVKVPIVVSVTGHTDIPEDNRDRIRAEVRHFLEGMRENYPHSDIILMSAMTNGSDLTAASVAKDMGLYIAPVFLEESEVSGSNVSSDQNTKDFRDVMSYAKCLDPKIIDPPYEDYPRRMRELGAFLVSYSHIMIVLWDGRSYSKNGGTYATLKMAINGCDWVHLDDYRDDIFGPKYVDIANDQLFDSKTLGWVDNCPVYWIQVERTTDSGKLVSDKGCMTPEIWNSGHRGYIRPEIFRSKEFEDADGEDLQMASYSVSDPHYPSKRFEFLIEETMPNFYDDLLRELDSMNQDLEGLEMPDDPEGILLTIKGDAEGAEDIRSEMDSVRSQGVMAACARRFAVMDRFSDACERKWYRYCIVMLLLNLINSIQFSLFILLDKNLLSGVLFLLTTSMVIAFNWLYFKTSYYHRFILSRSLSEMLRVNYFRGLMGLRCRLSDSFGYMAKSDLLLPIAVMKSWQGYFMNNVPEWNSFDKKKRIDLVKRCWLDGVLDTAVKTEYGNPGRRSIVQRYGNRKFFSLMDRTLNLVSIVISVTSIFLVLYLMWFYTGGFPYEPIYIFGLEITFEVIIKAILIAMMAVLSSIVVLTTLMVSIRSSRNDAKISTFRIAKRKLDRSHSFDEVVFSRMSKDDLDILILKELGDLTLNEINDWTYSQMQITVKKKNTLDTHGLV